MVRLARRMRPLVRLARRMRPLVRLARRMRLSVTSPVQNALFREGDTIASKIVVYGRREKKTIAYPRMSVRPRND